MQLWVFPALRHYRDLLHDEILPSSRPAPGLHSLPGGERCYAAELARQLGPSWTPDRLRRVAEASIDTVRSAPTPSGTAPELVRYEPSRWQLRATGAPFDSVWFREHPHPATLRGWALYARRDEAIGSAGTKFRAAARARADVGMHQDGWGLERTIQYLTATAGMTPETARDTAARIIATPGLEAAALAGLHDLQAARETHHELSGDEFRRRLIRFGPLPLDLISNAESF
jgi:uncharacterized protein (DUF885 family)